MPSPDSVCCKVVVIIPSSMNNRERKVTKMTQYPVYNLVNPRIREISAHENIKRQFS